MCTLSFFNVKNSNQRLKLRLYNTETKLNIKLDAALSIDDAINIPYVGDWKYNYREKGMQTSSDDVLIAFIACLHYYNNNTTFSSDGQMRSLHRIFDNLDLLPTLDQTIPSSAISYLDMGCGIGSSLLLIAHKIRPLSSTGVEAQEGSAALASMSVKEIVMNDPTVKITILHQDLRQLRPSNDDNISNIGSAQPLHMYDLITANPPYITLTNKTLSICDDSQRKFARFTFNGDVDEYMLTAKYVLAKTGRMIVSYWAKDNQRVYDAVDKAGLFVKTRVDVLMGARDEAVNDRHSSTDFGSIPDAPDLTTPNSPSTTTAEELPKPYMNLFEITHPPSGIDSSLGTDTSIVTLDLQFTRGLEATPQRYKAIQRWLDMRPRPLKRKAVKVSSKE